MKGEFQITLKAARINSGLKINEVSQLLGVNRHTLMSYENGRTIPDINLAKKLGDLYGLTVDQIFFGKANALSGEL